jgi:hypothetical protein
MARRRQKELEEMDNQFQAKYDEGRPRYDLNDPALTDISFR